MIYLIHRLNISVSLAAIGLLVTAGTVGFSIWQLIETKWIGHQQQLHCQHMQQVITELKSCEQKITDYSKVVRDAEQKGFFAELSLRKIVTLWKNLAQQCGIEDIRITFGIPHVVQEHMVIQPVIIVIKTALDRDIFQFIHKIYTQSGHMIAWNEISMFRTLTKSQIPIVHSEINCHIVHFK